MQIITFEVGPFMENTYLLKNEDEAILVDPGFDKESEYKAFSEALGSSDLKAIVLTHAHVDHALGLNRVLRDHDVDVYINQKDTFLWDNFESQSAMFGLNTGSFNVQPNNLPADEDFAIGGFHFRSLYTPGHSPDHISLYFEEEQAVIAGDALFKESIGRTDLYKGNFEVLKQSIQEKLYSLPDETTVYPGHGPATTIGHEKKFNPFVSQS